MSTMPLQIPPFNKPRPREDARTVKGAYISCGRNLYYVLRSAMSDRELVLLEDCKTLEASMSSREQVLSECKLERAAP